VHNPNEPQETWMTNQPDTYAMGHSDHERRRLGLQASLQNPVTDQLLRRAGILAGMRVLDLGCGIGDVSLLAAPLVGREGSVTGIDMDEGALAIARTRAADQNLRQLRFERCEIESLGSQPAYDAVIGRHILIHMRDPIDTLKRVSRVLKPGGVVAFHEYDFSVVDLAYPPSPIRSEMAALFARLLPVPNMGARLYHCFLKAGFSYPRCQIESLVTGGEGSPVYEIFAHAVVSMLPRIDAAGIKFSLPRDPDEMIRLLERESVQQMGSVPMPLTVSGYARWIT
jgi:ubiquinone/menaquinone biosynthesis C-methylase UbiE